MSEYTWNSVFANRIKNALAEGATLSEACNQVSLPIDLLLRWMDASSQEYIPNCAEAVSKGRSLAKVTSRPAQEAIEVRAKKTIFTPAILPVLEQVVVQEMTEGRSLNAVAAKFGISRKILEIWRAENPEVNEILEMGETLAITHIEEQGLKYMVEEPMGAKINSQVFKHMAAVADPERHNITSKAEVKNTGKPTVLENITFNIIQSPATPPALEREIKGEVLINDE